MDNKRKQTTLFSYMNKIPKIKLDEDHPANETDNIINVDCEKTPRIKEYSDFTVSQECSSTSSGLVKYYNPYDIGHFLKKKSDQLTKSSEELVNILNNLWYPEANYNFPVKENKNKKLKFQKHWFEKWHWLCYSEIFEAAFCKYCVLFLTNEVGKSKSQATGKLVSQPFDDWKHALELFNYHSNLQYHKSSIEVYTNLNNIENKSRVSIHNILDKKRQEEVLKNRERLGSIIKTVLFCGRQGIPLRGHLDYGPLNLNEEPDHNEGNFRALLRFRAESGDKILTEHLENCGRNSYISWRTQNEVISAANDIILKKIVERINRSQCFSVLADETTDIATVEQFSVCVRFIENDKICEEFLQFIPVVSTTGKDLAASLLEYLQRWKIDVKYLRGQGYDGARAMSGEFQGVQSQIRQHFPLALYVHCSSHCLNLAISDACTLPEIRNSIGIIGKIYEFFHTPKRQNVLETNIKKYYPESKKQKLVQMCATRWVERHDSVNVFVDLYNAIHPSLEEITDWNDKDSAVQASFLAIALCKPNFLIALLTLNKIFAITVTLSEYLQTVNIDLKRAMNYADHVIESIQNLKLNSDTVFKEIFEQASQFVKRLDEDEEIKLPRYSEKQSKYRTNIPATSAEEYYRRTIFLPFLDNIIMQLKLRLQKQNDILAKFACLTTTATDKETKNEFLELAKFYSVEEHIFLDSAEIMVAELELWKKCIKNIQINSAMEAYAFCDENFYPRIKRMLKILCTLPITTSCTERSFSTLRRLKTYLRNTMTTERLNGLALLNISQTKITPEQILEELGKKPRRLDFVIK